MQHNIFYLKKRTEWLSYLPSIPFKNSVYDAVLKNLQQQKTRLTYSSAFFFIQDKFVQGSDGEIGTKKLFTPRVKGKII